MRDDEIVAVSKLLRPYLGDLLGPAEAARVDQVIGAVLAGPEVEAPGQLREIAGSDIRLLRWVEDVLDDPRLLPPELQGVRSADYRPNLGNGEPVPADRFVCPVSADVVWYRPGVGRAIPTCGTHGQILVRG